MWQLSVVTLYQLIHFIATDHSVHQPHTQSSSGTNSDKIINDCVDVHMKVKSSTRCFPNKLLAPPHVEPLLCSVFLSHCCVLFGIFLTENCEVVIKEEEEKQLVESDCESDTEEAEEELVLEHPGQLCRLCASAVGEAVYIFGATGKEQCIAEKINSCLPVTVSYLHCTSVVIQNSRFVV